MMRGHALSVVGQGVARVETDYGASGVVRHGTKKHTKLKQRRAL